MKKLLPLLFLLGACASHNNEKKPDYTITFHTPGSDMDVPKTMFPMDLNGKRLLFKIVPDFSQQNIIAFKSFPSTTGNGNGVILHLDFRGKSMLELISRTRKDEYLLAMVNAKPVDYLVLDEPVLDGIVTIWQGVPDDVIKKMEKHIQRVQKDGGTPSMSKDMEMRPTTRDEKKRAFEAAKDQERQSKHGKSGGPEVRSLQLPASQVSPSIPLEGAAPPLRPLPSVPATPPSSPFDGTAPPLRPLPPVSAEPPPSGGGELPLPKP